MFSAVKEFISLPFVQNALLAGILVGVMAALVGSFVILRNLSFIGAGIAHSSFGGVVLGLLIGVNPLLTALVFSSATGIAIAAFSSKYEINEDSAVGVFFPFTMALGVILLGFVKGYTPDVMGYLFGDILLVSKEDVAFAFLSLLIVGLFFLVFYRALVYITFDEEGARISGIKVQFINYLFLAVIALVVVMAIKIVGIILLSGMIVIPPLISLQFSKNMTTYISLSTVIGALAVVLGLYLSYLFDLPSGATIVSFEFLLLLVALLIKRFYF